MVPELKDEKTRHKILSLKEVRAASLIATLPEARLSDVRIFYIPKNMSDLKIVKDIIELNDCRFEVKIGHRLDQRKKKVIGSDHLTRSEAPVD